MSSLTNYSHFFAHKCWRHRQYPQIYLTPILFFHFPVLEAPPISPTYLTPFHFLFPGNWLHREYSYSYRNPFLFFLSWVLAIPPLCVLPYIYILDVYMMFLWYWFRYHYNHFLFKLLLMAISCRFWTYLKIFGHICSTLICSK